MSEYISTFTTGFQNLIYDMIPYTLKGVKILALYDGLIYYAYSGKLQNIYSISYFSNTYLVLLKYENKGLSFKSMVKRMNLNRLKVSMCRFGTFRVRFSQENTFVKVEKSTSLMAERAIQQKLNLTLNRSGATNEFWFIIRREKVGFFCLLLKNNIAEKSVSKGELKPEVALLMCLYAKIKKNETVFDPFAGHGSIPLQIGKHFGSKQIIANDINNLNISNLKKKCKKEGIKIRLLNEDSLILDSISDHSIDVIITDPPWGYYETIENISLFYSKMMKSFKRVLKKDGRIIILTARKREMIETAQNQGIFLINQIDTLINGKKAGVYYFRLNLSPGDYSGAL